MKKLLLAAGLMMVGLTSLSACGKKSGFDGALDEMSGFKDQMCACKDKDCGEKVEKDYHEWKKGMKDKIGDAKPTDEQDKRGEALKTDMNKCRDALK